MAAKAFVVAPKDYAPVLNLVGEHITVLASGEATEGYEVFLQRGPEGSGPPAHSHPWDESFFVVKGQIDFGIGAESTTASPGTFVHLPAGTVHWFRFGGRRRMISMTSRLAPRGCSPTWRGRWRRWIPIWKSSQRSAPAMG